MKQTFRVSNARTIPTVTFTPTQPIDVTGASSQAPQQPPTLSIFQQQVANAIKSGVVIDPRQTIPIPKCEHCNGHCDGLCKRRLTDPDRISTGVVTKAGANLFYRIVGPLRSSKLIVFLHGFGDSSAYWTDQLKYFGKKGYTALAIDARGMGYSDKGTNPADYTAANLTDDPHFVVHALGLGSVPYTVVGHSGAGGLVAINYALTWPTEVENLVLVDTSPKLIDDISWTFGLTPAGVAALSLVATDFNAAAVAISQLSFNETCDPKKIARLIETARQIFLQSTQATLLLWLNTGSTLDFRPQLPTITAKTLVMFGDIDGFFPVQAGEYLRDNIPDAFLALFQDKGHVPFLTDVERFNHVLREFINGKLAECDVATDIPRPGHETSSSSSSR